MGPTPAAVHPAQGQASRRQLPARLLQGDESAPLHKYRCVEQTNKPAYGVTTFARGSTPCLLSVSPNGLLFSKVASSQVAQGFGRASCCPFQDAEKGWTQDATILCSVTTGMGEDRVCVLKTEQEGKPRAEVLWGGFGEKQKQTKTHRNYQSFACMANPNICILLFYLEIPRRGTEAQVWVTPSRCTCSLSLTLWVPSLISLWCRYLGASWPQQPAGHRHPPSPKSDRPATTSAGQHSCAKNSTKAVINKRSCLNQAPMVAFS